VSPTVKVTRRTDRTQVGRRNRTKVGNRLAFGQNDDANLVDPLRSGGYTRLSLVAEQDGAVIGHLLFSRLPIETATGIVRVLVLAPVAVLPDHQRQGLGLQLIRGGLASRGDVLIEWADSLAGCAVWNQSALTDPFVTPCRAGPVVIKAFDIKRDPADTLAATGR